MMGNHARENSAYGAQARPASAKQPNAMTAPPKLVNNQIPADLSGAVGGAWTPAQTQAGGRWEVPTGAPAGAIGRNWVPTPAPAASTAPSRLPSGRDALAHMIALSASDNGRYMPQRHPTDMWGGSSAWMNGGR
jgi:hypothetical protein